MLIVDLVLLSVRMKTKTKEQQQKGFVLFLPICFFFFCRCSSCCYWCTIIFQNMSWAVFVLSVQVKLV